MIELLQTSKQTKSNIIFLKICQRALPIQITDISITNSIPKPKKSCDQGHLQSASFHSVSIKPEDRNTVKAGREEGGKTLLPREI